MPGSLRIYRAPAARAPNLPGMAAGSQILLGDHESVFGIAQHQQAPPFAVTQAR